MSFSLQQDVKRKGGEENNRILSASLGKSCAPSGGMSAPFHVGKDLDLLLEKWERIKKN